MKIKENPAKAGFFMFSLHAKGFARERGKSFSREEIRMDLFYKLIYLSKNGSVVVN